MKLSENMLNFLGYTYETCEDGIDFIEAGFAVGLAYPLGIKSALDNGLIVQASHTLKFPEKGEPILPGCPYGRTFSGYRLTPLGVEIGRYGNLMRSKAKTQDQRSGYVKAAQYVLDARQRSAAS